MRPPYWSRQPETNDIVLDYYHDYGKVPKDELDEVKYYLQPFLDDVQQALWQQSLSGSWENAGSAFEGVHPTRPNGLIEIDKKFVVNHPTLSVHWFDDEPGWASIRGGYGPAFDNRGKLSKKSLLKIFEVACKNNKPDGVQFLRQGPAITMRGESDEGNRFSVDLVPGVSIPGESVFVPKPGPGQRKIDVAWKESFSLEERTEYPQDAPWAKPCLRIIKALRERSPELKKLQSYQLKNIFFWEVDEKPDAFWEEAYVSRRVWGLLHRLEKGLEEGCIPQFFNDDVNLIAKLSDDALDETYNFVHDLCTDESSFLEAFSVN